MSLTRTDYTPAEADAHASASAYTTGNFALTAGRTVLIFASCSAQTDPSIEGNDISLIASGTLNPLAQGATPASADWGIAMRAFLGVVPSTTNYTFTVQAGTKAVHNWIVEVFEYVGTQTPYVRQSKFGKLDSFTDVAGLTLDAAPLSASHVIASIFKNGGPTSYASTVPGATFTEIHDAMGDPTWMGVAQSQTRTASTSTTVDWSDLTEGGAPPGDPQGVVMMALEIAESTTNLFTRLERGTRGVDRGVSTGRA